jgi:hypothetical protein
VSFSFNFDSTLFTYDRLERQIKQTRIVKVPKNETIYITLKNQLGIKATYSMDLHFYCNATKNFTFNAWNRTETKQDPAKQQQLPKALISQIEPSGLLHVKFL